MFETLTRALFAAPLCIKNMFRDSNQEKVCSRTSLQQKKTVFLNLECFSLKSKESLGERQMGGQNVLCDFGGESRTLEHAPKPLLEGSESWIGRVSTAPSQENDRV